MIQRKRYLYASDAANAFDVILRKIDNENIFNLDSYDEISNRDLSARLTDLVASLGSNSSSGENANLDAWIKTISERPYANSGSRLNCEKLRSFKEDVHEIVKQKDFAIVRHELLNSSRTKKRVFVIVT